MISKLEKFAIVSLTCVSYPIIFSPLIFLRISVFS